MRAFQSGQHSECGDRAARCRKTATSGARSSDAPGRLLSCAQDGGIPVQMQVIVGRSGPKTLFLHRFCWSNPVHEKKLALAESTYYAWCSGRT
jgi:hypothetical protein